MHLPYSPNLTPPPTMTHPALHCKWRTKKSSYPQAHMSTAGNKKLPGANASSKHYSGFAKVMIWSLTTASPTPRTNVPPSPTTTQKMQSVWQSIPPIHKVTNQPTIGLAQRGQNTAYRLDSEFNWTIKKLNRNKHVSFAVQNKVHLFNVTSTPSIMLTYNSGANGPYISEHDQRKAGLPILRPSTQQVGVANGGTSNAKYGTQLPFCKLSAWSWQTDTFQDFPTSLMSVGKTSNDGTVSVFMKEGANVFKEEDVLITCKRGTNPHWHMRQPRSILNTLDATTGPLATTMPVQASTEGTTPCQ